MKLNWVMFAIAVLILTSCTIPGIEREETSPILTMFVGPEKVDCDNPLRNNECFQMKDNPEKNWEFYKGDIMGLQYEPGFFYELKVRRDTLSEPSVNSPELQWVLIEIVQKAPIAEEQEIMETDLTGFAWTLDQFGPPTALMSAIGETVPTITLGLDGKVTGDTGCNRYHGSYAFHDQKMQFSDIAVTKKMCAGQPGLLEQEQTILKTLANSGSYQFENARLMIFSSDNSLLLVFKK